MSIYRMKNIVQNYSWGSTDAIPRLLGYPNPDNKPQAELWMGAHPLGCSTVESVTGEQTLLQLITQQPECLGAITRKKFNSLPYLFKVLSAAQPLSLQAHPSKIQAEQGWREEQQQGLPLTAANRNYKDSNHKPEILRAVTEFIALAGFRPLGQIKNHLGTLLPQLGYDNHFDFFAALMRLPAADCQQALQKLPRLLADHQGEAAYDWVAKAAIIYPSDITVLAPLYLNLIKLAPGEAIYLPAGELHAYLHGTGIELMANSDNVLRAGMTSKHCDVAELLKVLNFQHRAPTMIGATAIDDWRYCYPTPAADFLLEEWQLSGSNQLECSGRPAIALLIGGQTLLRCSGRQLSLHKGESVFIAAEHSGLQLEGQAEIMVATLPE